MYFLVKKNARSVKKKHLRVRNTLLIAVLFLCGQALSPSLKQVASSDEKRHLVAHVLLKRFNASFCLQRKDHLPLEI